MKRLWILGLVAFACGTLGCAVSAPVTPHTELARPQSKITTDRGQPVAGYVDAMGRRHAMRGRVREIGADSLEFIIHKSTMFRLEQPKPDLHVRVHRDSVASLLVERIDPVRSTFAVVGISAAALFAVAAGAMADFCPLCIGQ